VSKSVSNKTEGLDDIRDAVNAVSDKLGRRLKFLVGKPGLDGHSNGAEQIAFRARDCGMDIDYEGIRLTPDQKLVTAGAGPEAERGIVAYGPGSPPGRSAARAQLALATSARSAAAGAPSGAKASPCCASRETYMLRWALIARPMWTRSLYSSWLACSRSAATLRS